MKLIDRPVLGALAVTLSIVVLASCSAATPTGAPSVPALPVAVRRAQLGPAIRLSFDTPVGNPVPDADAQAVTARPRLASIARQGDARHRRLAGHVRHS